ncbi:MAG TPA: hypothetical protein VLG47_07115 [Candidatus Saccharimonadales bacterium]|nr:hypothetical protein [Candidatus Saccharimonadales bacterium]
MGKTSSKKRAKRAQKSWVKRHPIRMRFLAIFVVVAVIGGIAYTINNSGKTDYRAANAIQTEFCAQWGSGFCLNNWNNGGYGNTVRMYRSGATNENFSAHFANVCGGNHFVTSTCPFNNRFHDYNHDYLNDPIYVIKYNPSGLCVGNTNADGRGYLKNCGSGNGAWFVAPGSAYINVSYTSNTNVLHYLCSGGVSGGFVNINPTYASGTCNWSQGY